MGEVVAGQGIFAPLISIWNMPSLDPRYRGRGGEEKKQRGIETGNLSGERKGGKVNRKEREKE